MDKKEYIKKQQNFCSNLLRKTKKDHFVKLDYISTVTDNKSF